MKHIASAKIVTAALCMTALFGCQKGSTGSTAETKKEGRVLAEVNGSTITTGDYDREVEELPDYYKSKAVTPQGRKEMLDTMVTGELILQKATKDGLDKNPEIAKKLEFLRKRLIVKSYLKKRMETDAKVSDDDLKKFYEQNKDKLKTGEQIKVSHILVKSEKDAKDILAQIKAGAKFEDLAKKNSVDSSAAQGGDLGWVGKGSLVPAFEKAALALKEGQISDVVKTDFGYHIIKLTGNRPAGVRPFEEVKEQLKAAIMPSKQQEVIQKIKEELKKDAKINIKEDVLNSMDAAKDESKSAAPAAPAAPEKK